MFMISLYWARGVGGEHRQRITHILLWLPTTNSNLDRKRIRQNEITTTINGNDSAPICSWPRFLILKGSDPNKPLAKLSPFAVNKCIVAILGTDPYNIKKLRDGNILVELDKEKQSKKLLEATKLSLTMDNFIPIEVSPHNFLNTKKGVIRCHDIKDCADDEILEGLEAEGVVKLDRITVFRDGQRRPTGTFILTFQCQVLPTAVRVGYLKVPVSQFIPNPMRCYKCQKFGHTKFHCQRKEVCPKCGKEDHLDINECPNQAKCVNCEGGHTANDKTCPKWK